MSVDLNVVPGLVLLLAELVALAGVGYVMSRVALRQQDEIQALAHGMVIGPALWGLAASFVLYVFPGRSGALISWIVVLALAAVLVWRTSWSLAPRTPVATTFAGTAALVFVVMLAARQWLRIPDDNIHLGISAYVEAGGWPPIAPWIPDQQLFYHYGSDVLIGLLDPPGGPDLAFTTEVLGAYVWTGFVFVLATAVLKRVGWIGVCALMPLVISTGAWTLIGFFIPPPDIVKIPVLSGIPAAGLRAALADVYWPEVSLQWRTEFEASPPNIWKPPFVMAYALTIIIVEWATNRRRRTWSTVAGIAVLVAFLGLLVEEIALTVLALWCVFETVRVVSLTPIASRFADLISSIRRQESKPHNAKSASTGADASCFANGLCQRRNDQIVDRTDRRSLLLAVAGPVMAAVLLAVGGGFFTGALSGEVSGASWGLIDDLGSRRPLGTLVRDLAGGIGILGLGVVPVCTVAMLVGWRNRLVMALIIGSFVFMLAAIVVQHRASQFDVTRMDGHARNFALLALLFALACGLRSLKPRSRYAACALIFLLVTWPTIAAPARMLGIETANGVELANADFEGAKHDPQFDSDTYYGGMGRFAIQHKVSDSIVKYIRGQTAVNDRILSPNPQAMSIATGRPNASGFAGFRHLVWKIGPVYIDAIRYLEPAAIRRLGFAYLHATDSWRMSLPPRAKAWLNDPTLFKPIVRGDTDALFRIEDRFFQLDVPPATRSFEALRRIVPLTATVYLGNGISEPMASLRAALTLTHARLIGDVDHSHIYLLSDVATENTDEALPDVIIIRNDLTFYANRIPELDMIWQGEGFAAYSTRSDISSVVDAAAVEADIILRLSAVSQSSDVAQFDVTFIDRAPEKWSGQDWLVVPVDESFWAPLQELKIIGSAPSDGMWFSGSFSPGSEVTEVSYEFAAAAGRLAIHSAAGTVADVPSSEGQLGPGAWMLVARLRHEYLQAALVPVLTFMISEDGIVTYHIREGDLGTVVNACPERLAHTDSCRHLARLAGTSTTLPDKQVFKLPD